MDLTNQHKLILDILQKHKGRFSAIKAYDLLEKFNSRVLITDRITLRTIRKLKEELNDNFGQFILSDNIVGYWIASCLNDIVEYEKFYRSYVDKMFLQIKKVKENYSKRNEKQEDLF